AMVRLYLASALQRIEPEKRWEILDALLQRTEDKEDPNLPLMLWYAAEPLIPLDAGRALEMAQRTNLPHILPFTKKRVEAIGTLEAERMLQDIDQKAKMIRNTHGFHRDQKGLR